MKTKTTFTEEQKRLYNIAAAEYQALSEPEPDDLQRAADRWLTGIMEGKQVRLDWQTKWALGEEEKDGGIAERLVTKHLAEAFRIRTYDDIVAYTPLDEEEE
jgi:hypothetical protein